MVPVGVSCARRGAARAIKNGKQRRKRRARLRQADQFDKAPPTLGRIRNESREILRSQSRIFTAMENRYLTRCASLFRKLHAFVAELRTCLLSCNIPRDSAPALRAPSH